MDGGRRALLGTAVVVAALALWGAKVLSRPDAADAVVVGVIAPFGTTPGEGIRRGVAMAVDEVNGAGGVLGRPLRVVEVDEAYSVDRAVQGYRQLASVDRAAVVVGIAGDGAFAVMDLLAEYRVPVLGTAVGADRLTDMVASDPSRYGAYFRVMHRSRELGEVTSAFARDCLFRRHGLARFAILRENAAWTESIARQWEETVRATDGMSVVASETFSSETRDFAPILLRIKASGAQYVLDACSRVEATSYLKQWATLQGPAIGAIPTGAGTRRYYEELGPAAVSVCSVSTIPSEAHRPTERSLDWWRRYRDRYGDPEYTSAYSYDAVHLFARAAEAAGSVEPTALVRALEGVEHTGAAARWSFGPDHHPRYGEGWRVIPVIQYFEPNATGFRVVWPESIAAGPFLLPPWSGSGGR